MTAGAPVAGLERALYLSRELLAAAGDSDLDALVRLDAERLQLLQSFRSGNGQPGADALSLLGEISQLNDLAIGRIEHHRRIKGRELDLAALGRRAVDAYSSTRMQR
ncbi:MAG TPA: hypothetical protein VII35_14470 [Steroidobacteraceae bacterium]